MAKTVKDNGPDPVDVYVGKRIRARRTIIGVSQEQLAAVIGVSFQQVQKYEKGSNRVSASKLFDLSRALGVTLSFFFDGMEDYVPDDRIADSIKPVECDDKMSSLESIEMLRCYWRLNSEQRENLTKFMQSIAVYD